MQATTNRVNVVVYGSSETDARAIAAQVIGETEERGVYVSQHDNWNVKGYIRYPGGSSYTIPQGVTDAIIVHVPSASDSFVQTIQQYLADRSTVPVRIVLTGDESVNTTFQQQEAIITADQGGLKDLLWSHFKSSRDQLNGLFNKHAQPDGLNLEGFRSLLQEHNHGVEGEHEYLFHHRQLLSFHDFYNWWVLGRNDSHYYLGINNMGSELPKLSSILGENWEKAKTVLGHDYHGKLDVGSDSEFNSGLKFGIELNAGDNFHNISQGFSHSQLASAFTATLEIGVEDPSAVPAIIEKLNSIKEMAKSMAQIVRYLLRSGMDVQFRNVGNRFYIDLVVSGIFGELIHRAIPSNVDFHSLHYTANTSFTFSTGFSPVSLHNKPLEEIIRSALNLSIKGTGNITNLGTIISLLGTLLDIAKLSGKDRKFADLALSALKIIKQFGFEIKYDPLDLFQTVSELVATQMGAQPSLDPVGNLQIASQMFAGLQQNAEPFIQQGKAMLGFAADFMDIITNVNIDNIRVSLSSPLLRLNYQTFLELPGTTAWIHQNILQ